MDDTSICRLANLAATLAAQTATVILRAAYREKRQEEVGAEVPAHHHGEHEKDAELGVNKHSGGQHPGAGHESGESGERDGGAHMRQRHFDSARALALRRRLQVGDRVVGGEVNRQADCNGNGNGL